MADWSGNGMVSDDEYLMDALDDLGCMPEEIMAISDYCMREAWVWAKVARTHRNSKLCMEISEYMRRRARKFKELAAIAEREMTEEAMISN